MLYNHSNATVQYLPSCRGAVGKSDLLLGRREQGDEKLWEGGGGETSDVWAGVDDGCWRAEEKNLTHLCGKRWNEETPTVSRESLRDFAT